MEKTLSKPLAIIELLRPLNCLMAAFAAILGYWLSAGAVGIVPGALLAAASTFIICGAGMAINDYYDLSVDSKAKKTRPIPSGRISALEARSVAISLFILGIMVAYYANARAFEVAIAFSILLYVYSSRLSKLKYFGNAVVALSNAFTFIMGASVTGNYSLVIIVASASFFLTWAREIAKDLEDFEADKGKKSTLPMLIGKKNAANTAILSTVVSVAVALLPLLLGLTTSFLFAGLLFVSIAVFTDAVLMLWSGKFRSSQISYKYGMIVALAAFASLLLA